MKLLFSVFLLIIVIEISILLFFFLLCVIGYFFRQYDRAKRRNQGRRRRDAQGQQSDEKADEAYYGKDKDSLKRTEDSLTQQGCDTTDIHTLHEYMSRPIHFQKELDLHGPSEKLQLSLLGASKDVSMERSEYTDSGSLSQKYIGIRLGIRDGEAGDTYRKKPYVVEKEDGELKIVRLEGMSYCVVPAKTVLVESDWIDSALKSYFSFKPEPVFDGDCHKYKMTVRNEARLLKAGNTYKLLFEGEILLERIG